MALVDNNPIHCRIARSRFKNVANSSPTADSGVTNTPLLRLADADSATLHTIPSFLHRCAMSPRNAINGTTTTVVPPCSAHAGNMNNKLLPAPVGITATTGLSPAVIALIAASCTPRNLASSPIMRFSCALASIFLSRCHRSTLASSASLSNGALFRLLLLL
ncbi:hypothetical protein PTNB73_10603 [Pyrenophora teres f. teres]|nr:hypothetical protein PTNB73_10603 [Pyrenophora teres f. teres]